MPDGHRLGTAQSGQSGSPVADVRLGALRRVFRIQVRAPSCFSTHGQYRRKSCPQSSINKCMALPPASSTHSWEVPTHDHAASNSVRCSEVRPVTTLTSITHRSYAVTRRWVAAVSISRFDSIRRTCVPPSSFLARTRCHAPRLYYQNAEQSNQKRCTRPTPTAIWLRDDDGEPLKPSPSDAVASMILPLFSVSPFAR